MTHLLELQHPGILVLKAYPCPENAHDKLVRWNSFLKINIRNEKKGGGGEKHLEMLFKVIMQRGKTWNKKLWQLALKNVILLKLCSAEVKTPSLMSQTLPQAELALWALDSFPHAECMMVNLPTWQHLRITWKESQWKIVYWPVGMPLGIRWIA